MAQIIQTICDVCQELNEDTQPGNPIRIGFAEIDLCAEHVNNMTLGALLGLMEDGHIGARPPADESAWMCPHGCNRKSFKSERGLALHTARMHK